MRRPPDNTSYATLADVDQSEIDEIARQVARQATDVLAGANPRIHAEPSEFALGAETIVAGRGRTSAGISRRSAHSANDVWMDEGRLQCKPPPRAVWLVRGVNIYRVSLWTHTKTPPVFKFCWSLIPAGVAGGHAPKHLHEELSNDYRDMIYADTAAEVETHRKAFLRKWRLKCKAVADSLVGEGGPWPRWGRVSPLNGDRLFTFTRLDPAQWKAARTTNAIERLNEEFRRRVKTQAVLPQAEIVPMLRLGAARLRPDTQAQGRRPANPRQTDRAHAP